jgi:hypothetical protein
MYNGRLQAVYKPMILHKAPRLLEATTAPSSHERTTGARAPRLNRQASAALYVGRLRRSRDVGIWRQINPSMREGAAVGASMARRSPKLGSQPLDLSRSVRRRAGGRP